MTAAHSSVQDSFRDGSLERFTYFQKDEFESDWEKLAERNFGRVYKVKVKVWRETCALKTTVNDYRYEYTLELKIKTLLLLKLWDYTIL